MLQPMIIEPKITSAIWGGDALLRVYGKSGNTSAALGESWECWDDNVVRSGSFAGKSIKELREVLRGRLMGSLDSGRIFPVLTKIIDARESLSVQVHPDDAYAERVEGQQNGKTECWVILSAEPGAELVLGWAKSTNRAEYERRVADGSLGDILRRVPVKPNDAFYLPSGTLHAIGAGIQLFETQQASDLTYRIFDWNRLGPDGKPRQLHVDRAADVLDYSQGKTAQTTHLLYRSDGIANEAYIADPRFVVERVRLTSAKGALLPDGEPLIFMAMDEGMSLEVDGVSTAVQPWTTALIPADIARVDVTPSRSDATALIVTTSRDVFFRRLARSGVAEADRDAFMAQFEATSTPA